MSERRQDGRSVRGGGRLGAEGMGDPGGRGGEEGWGHEDSEQRLRRVGAEGRGGHPSEGEAASERQGAGEGGSDIALMRTGLSALTIEGERVLASLQEGLGSWGRGDGV